MNNVNKLTQFIIKKWKIFTALVIILLAGMSYVAFSVVYWRDVDKTTAQAKKLTDDTLIMFQSSSLNTDSIKEIYQKLESVDDSCSSDILSWQANLIDDKKTSLNNCNNATDKVKQQKESVAKLLSHIEKESKVADIITQANNKLKDIKTTDYGQYKNIWQEVVNSVREVGSEDGFTVTNSITEKSQQLISAYDKLESADKAQNRKEYDTAMGEVDQLYGEIIGLQVQATDEYNKKIDSLIESYKSNQ